MAAKYYMTKDWETYPSSNRYNFFLQVYDENYKEVEHPANDRCYWPTAWRKIAAQRGRAIKKAMKAGLTEIFQMPVRAIEAEPKNV
ncbi:MAG: hypothetical protein EOO14_00405 [Chitinophagaceae bacterium]|nr:MAG: hypothetical protein EOO14_00405 [Chitinophagaceae bacterium]